MTIEAGANWALTDDEKAQYNALCLGIGGEPALLRCELDGRPVAVAAVIHQEAEEEYQISPLAILVNEELAARLTLTGKPMNEEEA